MQGLLALALIALLGSAAQAQGRLLDAREHAGWQAIGRVNQAGFRMRSLCTGTLIAPDKVLTAAHCFDPARRDPVVFVAGWYRSERAASRRASQIHVATGFAPDAPRTLDMVARDWAILTLDTPITEVDPIPFLGRRPSESLDLVAYSASRPHALEARGPCAILTANERLIALDCVSERGNSGGPALQEVDGAWRVVGVLSGGTADLSVVVSPGVEMRRLIR